MIFDDVVLDKQIQQNMKQHQIVGANFLIDRLLGREILGEDNDVNVCKELLPTGAILADEVGTGKTLTSLSVIWSFCNKGRCKVIVVCPAGLIKNWESEILRWMPNSLGRSTLYLYGGKSNSSKVRLNLISSHVHE